MIVIRKYRQITQHYVRIVIWSIFVLGVLHTKAQKALIHFDGLPEGFQPKIERSDSTTLLMVGHKTIRQLRSNGYWTAMVDTLSWDGKIGHIRIVSGRKFQRLQLSVAHSKNPNIDHKDLGSNLNAINEQINELLTWHENHGFPFVSMNIDSAHWKEDTLCLKMRVEPGMKITYDSLQLNPVDVLSSRFAMKFLGLQYDGIYREEDIQQIRRKMQNLDFLYFKNADVYFRLKKAQVRLEVEKRNTSHFDGILGMLPDQEDNSGVIFTGELNLALNNLFKSAKSLEIHWQRLQPETQSLRTKYRHPLLFGTPLNLNLAFDQIKQDSSFSNRKLMIGMDYYITPKLNMSMMYENKLGNELEGIASNTADFKWNQYGLGMVFRDFDDNLMPRKGYGLSAEISTGLKEVTSESADEIRSTQYSININQTSLFQIGENLSIVGQSKVGKLFNNNLFLNDLFRLGGLRSVRGFNEGEFFASEYAVISSELRFYLDRSSYFTTFYDQGFMAFDIINGEEFERPSALGMGIQIQTNSGKILVLYGLGKRSGESFSFNSSKIHFGYTALF